MTADHLALDTPDGRTLDVLLMGVPDGYPLIYHSGTPSGAAPYPMLDHEAARRGLRVITWSRPGYGRSTARPGRSVADVVTDTEVVCNATGIDQFLTLGYSGGGPHALACAALLPTRCLAAASLAGVAPYSAEGLDWMAGMGEENVEEFGAALQGEAALTAWLEPQAEALSHLSPTDVAASLGDLAALIDVAALDRPEAADLADYLAASFRAACVGGIDGWRDDDLAFVRDWGYSLAAIDVPVSVWQGAQDRMVPYAHGDWLAAHVPGATAHLEPDEGHISLVLQIGRVLDDVASRLP